MVTDMLAATLRHSAGIRPNQALSTETGSGGIVRVKPQERQATENLVI